MTATERKSDFKLTKHTPYLALTGQLWSVFYKNSEANWLRYNGTALYLNPSTNLRVAVSSEAYAAP